jgi:hypothetical protein
VDRDHDSDSESDSHTDDSDEEKEHPTKKTKDEEKYGWDYARPRMSASKALPLPAVWQPEKSPKGNATIKDWFRLGDVLVLHSGARARLTHKADDEIHLGNEAHHGFLHCNRFIMFSF